jgi:membrane protease YdiL (CAAX protease family)
MIPILAAIADSSDVDGWQRLKDMAEVLDFGHAALPVLTDREPAAIVLFLLGVLVLSFILTWLYNGTGGSLLAPLLFRAAQNSAALVALRVRRPAAVP